MALLAATLAGAPACEERVPEGSAGAAAERAPHTASSSTPSETAPAAEPARGGSGAEPGVPENGAEAARPGEREPPGVVIEDLVIGTGAEARPNSIIKVHYRGLLKDTGVEFDTSYGGYPVEHALIDFIDGWQEGVPGMRVGGIRRLTVPWALAWGDDGDPPGVPPKSDVIFEIELLSVR